MNPNWRTSSIPRVKSALFDLLSQISWPNDVGATTVCYGRPRDFSREDVIIGDTSQSSQDWSALGDLQRQEEFEIELLVRVLTPGLTQREATERAFELFGAIELALRSQPTLGVSGVSFAHIATPRLNEGVLEEGYGAFIESGLSVSGRI